MLKGNFSRKKRTFNSIMSCIRIAAENGFAGQHNCFNFLSFKSGHKLGARKLARMYMCATFIHDCTFYILRKPIFGSHWLSNDDNRRVFGVVNALYLRASRRDMRVSAPLIDCINSICNTKIKKIRVIYYPFAVFDNHESVSFSHGFKLYDKQ